jgi:hypothetical protein
MLPGAARFEFVAKDLQTRDGMGLPSFLATNRDTVSPGPVPFKTGET